MKIGSNDRSISNGENICREVLTVLFPNNIFKKCRPQWLMNKKPMELDLFCEELKLAVEFNGAQHYKFCSFFHKTEADFNDQIARDKLKNKLCKENGVKLITVPYTTKNIGKFIMNCFTPVKEEKITVDGLIETLYEKITSIFSSGNIEPFSTGYSICNYKNISFIFDNENNFVNLSHLVDEAMKYENNLITKKKIITDWFDNKEKNNFFKNIKQLLNITKLIYVLGTEIYIHPILTIFLVKWVSPTYSLIFNKLILSL